MGSIPLAANNLRVPEQPNALEQYARLVQLQQQQKMMPGQLQQQQQQIQAGQQENQQRAQALKDQTAMTAAYKTWDGKNPDDLAKLVSDNGGSATARTNIEQHYLGLKKTYSDIAKTDAETGKNNLDILKQKNDNTLGAITAAESVPDEQLGAHLAQTVQQLTQQQMLDPEHAQMGQALVQGLQSGQMQPADARQALAIFKKGLQSNSQQLAQAKEEAEAKKNNAQAVKDTEETNLIKKFGGTSVEAQQQADWLAKNPGKGPADFMAYKAKLVPQLNFNLQNSGATGTPGQPSAMAKAIAANEMKWSDAVSARTPMNVKTALLAEVKSINPAYKSSDFDVEKKVQEKATSGSWSDQLTAINTAREHMATFKQTADALGNGNVLYANKVGNWMGTQFGQDKATNFNVARSAFAGEVGKAFAGANVGVGDRQELIDKINESSSWAQLKGYADTADKLLAGKQKSIKESVDQGMKGKPNFGEQGAAQSSTTITVTAPNGKTYNFPDQDSADSFKKRVGIPK